MEYMWYGRMSGSPKPLSMCRRDEKQNTPVALVPEALFVHCRNRILFFIMPLINAWTGINLSSSIWKLV
jgi:hypothetical protein